LIEQLLEDDAVQITRKVVELAKKGNFPAIRLCMDRILPVRKERLIELEVRPTENSNQLPLTSQDLLIAVAEGRITPGEAQALSNVMSSHTQSLAAYDLVRRVELLESAPDNMRRQKEELERLKGDIVREAEEARRTAET
jgi:hypothetical protein